jgi:hypothetical protein
MLFFDFFIAEDLFVLKKMKEKSFLKYSDILYLQNQQNGNETINYSKCRENLL